MKRPLSASVMKFSNLENQASLLMLIKSHHLKLQKKNWTPPKLLMKRNFSNNQILSSIDTIISNFKAWLKTKNLYCQSKNLYWTKVISHVSSPCKFQILFCQRHEVLSTCQLPMDLLCEVQWQNIWQIR